MMFYNKYKNVSTYIIIFLVSSAAFAIFLLSANISAHSEQVYEMTDHQIKNNTINKAYEHKDPTNNSEQRDGESVRFNKLIHCHNVILPIFAK